MVSDHVQTPFSGPKDYLTDPTVPYAPADLLRRADPLVYLTYHVAAAGFGGLAPLGAGLGALLHGAGLRPRSAPTLLASAGTAAGAAGLAGAALGFYKMRAIRLQGGPSETHPRPWTAEGHRDRVMHLNHNFKARLLDAASATGMAAAAGVLLAKGGPRHVGLSSGALGVFQAVSLGSATGGVGALIILYGLVRRASHVADSD